jgi:cellulose biosynthesis protein BcsQ
MPVKVIAAVAEKGGVGRTALSCILAAGLSQAGARVLMVVLDVHVAGAAVFLPPPVDTAGAAELLLGGEVRARAGHLGVHVLGGGAALDGGDIRALRSDELRFALQRVQHHYDAVVVDAAPVLLHLQRLALEAADLALVITDAQSHESINGLARVMAEIDTARSRQAPVPGLVIPVVNKVDRRHALDGQLADLVIRSHGARHEVIEIPTASVVPQALAQRRPELALNTQSPARAALFALVTRAGQLIAEGEQAEPAGSAPG